MPYRTSKGEKDSKELQEREQIGRRITYQNVT